MTGFSIGNCIGMCRGKKLRVGTAKRMADRHERLPVLPETDLSQLGCAEARRRHLGEVVILGRHPEDRDGGLAAALELGRHLARRHRLGQAV